MGFTAKWLLPPFVLVAFSAAIDFPHKPGILAGTCLVAAFLWWVCGIFAVRTYWRGRWAARGARDSFRR